MGRHHGCIGHEREIALYLTAMQHGITHAFVVQFANAADRDYYCTTDPAHMNFVKNLQGKVEKVQAVDYEVGKF